MAEKQPQHISNKVNIRGLVVRVYEKRYDNAPEAYLISFYTKYPFIKGGHTSETYTRNAFIVKTISEDLPEAGDVIDLEAVLNIYNDKAYLYEIGRSFVKKSENFQRENRRKPEPKPEPKEDDMEFGGDEIPF